MPQTPKSVSVNLAGSPATAYTVPAATTAVLKTVLGQNVTGSNSSFTVQKLNGSTYSPLNINQNPIVTPATGGTAYNSVNLIAGPVTLATGDSIVVSDTANAQFRFPQTSNTFIPTETNSYIARTMLFGNGVYVMVLSDQTNGRSMVVRSTDANTWTEIATGNLLSSASTYYIARNGSTWVVAQWNTINYMYSTDNALTWTAASLPANGLIYDVEGNGTTFVFATAAGLYTATTLPTTTLNTAYNDLLGLAIPSNSAYRPQVASWNGTYWFISNHYGTFVSSDLATYTALYSPTGGSYPTGGAYTGITWSAAYSRYYGTPIMGGANFTRAIMPSSTNGFTWSLTDTGLNAFNANSKVVSAGASTVLLAQNAGSSSFLKSTNGSTWASASAIRGSTYSGMIEGLSNGTFILTQQNTNPGYYISTDPTTVNGTAFSASASSNTIWLGAASDGTGWALMYYDYINGGSAFLDWGTNSSTRSGTGQYSTLPAGSSCYQILWWNAASRWIVISNTAMYTNTNPGDNFTAYPQNYASGSAQAIVVNNILYIWGSNNTNVIYSLTAAQFSAGAAFTINTLLTPAYQNGAGSAYTGSLPNSAYINNRAFATNGTDLIVYNNQGGAAVLTPSLGFSFRTPGSGGLFVERVNNLDIVYTGRTSVTNSSNTTFGFFYGSNIFTTLPTSSTSVGAQFCAGLSNNPGSSLNIIGNRVTFYGGAYYAAPDQSDTISIAPTNIKLFTNYGVSSIAIGQVAPVCALVSNNSQNRYQTDGTNFLTYNNAFTRISTYKGTTPASTLAASTVTFGLVEIT